MSNCSASLDNLTTGVVSLDAQMQVLSMNGAAEGLLEVSAARVTGGHAHDLIAPDPEWRRVLQHTVDTHQSQALRELPITLLNGNTVTVDLLLTGWEREDGSRGMIIELTPLDRLLRISRDENALLANETTRAVLRGLAHEIKNPLGGVRGAAQLLAGELPDPALKEYTRIIISEADRLRDLVDRLLGPRQAPQLVPTNIHRVLERVAELIRAEAGNRITLERDYDPSIPELPADRDLLLQAVLNIARNAMQALYGAGTEDACITLRSRSQRQYTIGTVRHRLVCRVEICDNGPGIPDELMHAIFVPMVSGRADGSGLGLSISQAIINQHAGLLECESKPGNTVFRIHLPMETHHAESR